MKNFKSCLVGFLSLFRPFRVEVLIAITIGLAKVAASLAFVWANRRLVDIATGDSSMDFTLGVAILIGIVLFQIGCEVFSGYWGRVFSVRATNRLRYNTFSHVLESTWNGREAYHSGDTTNRLFEDIRLVVNMICIKVPDIVVTVCQLIAASFYLMTLQASLLWFLLILMFLVAVLSKAFFKKLRALSVKIRTLEASTQQQMQDNLINRALVLTLFGTKKILEKLGYTMKETETLSVERQKFISVSRGLMGLGFMGGYTAAFLWGVFGIRSGAVTFGMMTAFLQLVGQIQRPVAGLSNNIPEFINTLTSVERLMELDELPDAASQERRSCDKAPSIVLDNVTFSYSDQKRNVLENFSYTFEAGSLTLIMGPTGAGKSTLIRIVMGLLAPSSGKVTLFTNDSYMYVPQGNSLLSGTIRENLLLASPDATEEEMHKALHTAAADFVFTLPDGLDSICGEVGSGLSEGQAQRIAIARALLHNGHILILDEATSALDVETEKEVISNIAKEYRGDRTILFISHREAVTQYADFLLHLQIISNLR